MKQKIILVFLALFLYLINFSIQAWSQSSIKLSWGLGYDNVSERYNLIHYDTLTVPSESLEVLRKTTDETEEQKAIFKFDLSKNLTNDSRLSVSNRFSLSSLYLRDILRIEWDRGWLNLSNESELKTIQDTVRVTYQSDYFINNLDLKLRTDLNSNTTLRFKNNLEYVEYKDKSAYAYDYYLNRTSLELDGDISEDGYLHLAYQLSRREAPDSSLIDYHRHFLDISLDKYFGWKTLLKLTNELDRKTFDKPGKQDDFWENQFHVDLNRKISDLAELSFYNEFNLLGYDAEDEINFDRFEYKFSTVLEYELVEGLKMGAGPEWISFFSFKNIYSDYDYKQLTLDASFDMLRSINFWLSAEDKFGRRDYQSDENPFYTDYLLNQLSLFLNADFSSHLGFNLMFSMDSEWHDLKENDLTVFLISSELIYSF